MASQAIAPTGDVHAPAGISDRPYAPSWFDWILDWMVARPGPTLLAYAAFGLVALAWTTSVGWLGGVIPIGTIDPTQTSYAFFLVAPFALVHVLDGAASRALRGFVPALDASPAELERHDYELTTIPPRPAVALLAAGAGMDLLSWVADPVGSGVEGWAPAGLVLRAAGEYLLTGAWLVVIYHVIRQLRLVARLHGRAVHIDLFRPGPVHAFSQLTVRTGISLVVVAAFVVLTTPPELLLTPVTVVFEVVIVMTGAAAFVLPLRGMQRQLAAQKDRLLDGVNGRLEKTMSRLHAAVDADDLAPADGLQKTLTALVQEREIVGRLRTWPWDPGTLRAFASAILLPIGLWFATRLLERLV